jgi:hypothetical protein
MITQAAEALALDLPRSWLVGDAPRDIEAGKAAGCRTILFTPSGVSASPAAGEASAVEPDHAVTSLHDAIEYIAHHRAAGDDASPAPAEVSEPHTMSIPQHPHIPQRVESAARAEDSAPDAPLPPMEPHPPHAHQTTVTMPPRTAEPRDSREQRDNRLHVLAEQILDELRRSKEQPVQDFSVAKMLAGVAQVMTLAVLFVAYLNRADPVALMNTLVFALTMQTMTIALLIFNRQR